MGILAQLPKEVLLHQLSNGLILMLIGMGTVFLFLVILVYVIKALSAIVRKTTPAKPVAAPAPAAVAAVPAASQTVDAEIAAAIVAAVAKSKK